MHCQPGLFHYRENVRRDFVQCVGVGVDAHVGTFAIDRFSCLQDKFDFVEPSQRSEIGTPLGSRIVGVQSLVNCRWRSGEPDDCAGCGNRIAIGLSQHGAAAE